MKRHIKLALHLIKLNIEKDLIYSLNSWFLFITTSVYTLTFILALKFVFTQVDQVLGYSYYELSLLLIGGQTFWYVHQVFVRKSFQLIADSINTGDFDRFLLKPWSFKKIAPFLEFDQRHVIPSVVMIIILAMRISEVNPSAWQIFWSILFFINGLVISFFLSAIFAMQSFWFGRNDSVFEIMMYVVDIVKLPVAFFPVMFQVVFVAFLPAILIVNPSFQILTGRTDIHLIFATIAMTIILFILTEILWRRGIKAYTSAN